MQTLPIQVFNLPFPTSLAAMRTSLNGKTSFKCHKVTRLFQSRVLDLIESTTELVPTLRIYHRRWKFSVSLVLLAKVSNYFNQILLAQNSLAAIERIRLDDSKISETGLKLLIDYSQGAELNLQMLSARRLEKVIETSTHLQAEAILNAAGEIVRRNALTLSVSQVMDYALRITSISPYYKNLFGTIFSEYLEHHLFRSSQFQYNDSENAALETLLTFLKTNNFPLNLNLQHWNPNESPPLELVDLNIETLDLRDSSARIDLVNFTNLTQFKGASTHCSDFGALTHLSTLVLDELPSSLPRSLTSLHLGELDFENMDPVRDVPNFSSDNPLDIVHLDELAYPFSSLKLLSGSGSLSTDRILRLQQHPIAILTLSQITFNPLIESPPPIPTLREATLIQCGEEVFQWICTSPVTKLTVHATIREDTLGWLPLTLNSLDLQHSNDETHTADARILRSVSSLTNLTSLHLSGFSWGDGGFPFVGNLHRLEELFISVDGAFFPGNLSVLQSLANLSTFIVESGKEWPTEWNELKILSDLNLTHLKIKPLLAKDHNVRENSITGDRLNELGKMTSLTTLNLSGTRLNDISFINLLSRLQQLNLGGCRQVPPQGLFSLTGLARLEVVQHNIGLSQAQIGAFFRQVPSLRRLVNNR